MDVSGPVGGRVQEEVDQLAKRLAKGLYVPQDKGRCEVLHFVPPHLFVFSEESPAGDWPSWELKNILDGKVAMEATDIPP